MKTENLLQTPKCCFIYYQMQNYRQILNSIDQCDVNQTCSKVFGYLISQPTNETISYILDYTNKWPSVMYEIVFNQPVQCMTCAS